MATAGIGDVLPIGCESGSADRFDGCADDDRAAFVHAAAGDTALTGERGLLASDFVCTVPGHGSIPSLESGRPCTTGLGHYIAQAIIALHPSRDLRFTWKVDLALARRHSHVGCRPAGLLAGAQSHLCPAEPYAVAGFSSCGSNLCPLRILLNSVCRYIAGPRTDCLPGRWRGREQLPDGRSSTVLDTG